MRRLNKFRLYLAAALLAVTTLCAQQASTQQKGKQKQDEKQNGTAQASAQQADTQKYSPCQSPCQFRFVVYGDTRNNDVATDDDNNQLPLREFDGDKTHKMILDEVVKFKPQLILQTGDLVNNGGIPSEWTHFRLLTNYNETDHTVRCIPYYPAPGNHDKCGENNYEKFIPTSVNRDGFHYYFDFSSDKVTTPDKVTIRFISIDTVPDEHPNCTSTPGSVVEPQLTWLEKRLKEVKEARGAQDPTKKKFFVVPFFHHPIYSIGKHGGNDYDGTSRKDLEDTFNKKEYAGIVRLVFQGHDHDYYYTKVGDIAYVVSGGGGAPLYNKDHERDKPLSGDDIFLYSYNFSVCDVYPDEIRVTTYYSSPVNPAIPSDTYKYSATGFTLTHKFFVSL